jgi:uncharacterized protein YlaN (UPF0358 family)
MKMSKLAKVSSKFERVLDLLNEAECTIQSIKEIESVVGEKLNFKFTELFGLVEETQYEVCMPLEMEEEEREQEIAVLERRLAELKSTR